MQIGPVVLENPVVLAPMAGITDAPFRRIVKRFGPGLLCGEMVSATALHYQSGKSRQLIAVNPAERPISIQIFGSEPAIMAEAARMAADRGADVIDINMGCPVPKVVKNGEGAALLNNLPLAARIIRAVVGSVAVPVTVKFRLGWDEEHLVAVALARIAAAEGAAAVAVHGRTRNQFYQGKADWEQIGLVKQQVTIPVIGNGDIDSPQAARALLAATGCDGVMVGQAALGRPWLFAQIVAYLVKQRRLPEPALAERFAIIRDHLDYQIAYSGESRGVKEMRKHLAWYFKQLPGAARMRNLVNTLTTCKEVYKALQEYEAGLSCGNLGRKGE
ncbi:MAG: tRNA dihydrouridine synthase DusB [Bacillota bacterium]